MRRILADRILPNSDAQISYRMTARNCYGGLLFLRLDTPEADLSVVQGNLICSGQLHSLICRNY